MKHTTDKLRAVATSAWFSDEQPKTMKYRKKPVIIEATQYRDQMRKDGNLPKGVFICPWPEHGDQPTVHTIHAGQSVMIEDGDWIITEPDGVHYYPCKPDIFEKTYEPVDSENALAHSQKGRERGPDNTQD